MDDNEKMKGLLYSIFVWAQLSEYGKMQKSGTT